jgi:hypothetical protein
MHLQTWSPLKKDFNVLDNRPISACSYSESHNAITPYSDFHFSLFINKSPISCLNIIEHKWLCLVNYYILTPNNNMH